MTIPVTLDDAKAQLRVDGDEQDVEITGFIADAAAWIEQYTGHLLIARDVTERFRCARAWLELTAWPIAVDAVAAVSYTADDGSTVALTGTRLDASRRPARLWPAGGETWPVTSTGTEMQVTIRAGYEDGDVVPGTFRRAMLVLIGAYNQDREGGDLLQKAEDTARSLCTAYRLWLI